MTIRIFCDGSVMDVREISAWCILVENKFYNIGYDVRKGKSTCNAELEAIRLSLQSINGVLKGAAKVLIYSDNLDAIAIAREADWYKNITEVKVKIVKVNGHTMGYNSQHTYVDRLARAINRRLKLKGENNVCRNEFSLFNDMQDY